jgi:APA family basic amino acid/polyamine antiporter
VPILPLIGIVFSAWLIASLQPLTWLRFVIWMAIGLVIYFSYGIRHSRLGIQDVFTRGDQQATETPEGVRRQPRP